MLQLLLAVLAGILTVGAPCILPLLPILLGSSVGQKSSARPMLVALGFIVSFSGLAILFAVFTNILGLSQNTLRQVAIVLLALFGLLMIWPSWFKKIINHFNGFIGRAQMVSRQAGSGNWGAIVLGLLLGIIWTPCAGPVLGTILTFVATANDLGRAGVLLVAYAIGAGIPMVIIGYGGQYLTTRISHLARYSQIIQQLFGVLILALAIAMFFNYDLVLQAQLTAWYPNLVPKL